MKDFTPAASRRPDENTHPSARCQRRYSLPLALRLLNRHVTINFRIGNYLLLSVRPVNLDALRASGSQPHDQPRIIRRQVTAAGRDIKNLPAVAAAYDYDARTNSLSI